MTPSDVSEVTAVVACASLDEPDWDWITRTLARLISSPEEACRVIALLAMHGAAFVRAHGMPPASESGFYAMSAPDADRQTEWGMRVLVAVLNADPGMIVALIEAGFDDEEGAVECVMTMLDLVAGLGKALPDE